MPRRVPSSHRSAQFTSDNNPYQPTTTPLQTSHHHHQSNARSSKREHKRYSHHNNGYQNPTAVDTGLSDATFTESETYYDYHRQQGYQLKNDYREGYSFSDDSGSIRIPLYDDDDDLSSRRFSRNTFSEGNFARAHQFNESNANHHETRRNSRKVYPNPCGEMGWDRVYQEIVTPGVNQMPTHAPPQRLLAAQVSSDRPQSAMSSAVTTLVVDGCGGRCQTCENVCYFFLQLVFTMGILVGVSLCFAAAALRKSAARNLQVLVYIGVLVTMVCCLLLWIQCSARRDATRRRKAITVAKQRLPIPMENLTGRLNRAERAREQPLVVTGLVDGNQRIQITQNATKVNRPLPHRPHSSRSPTLSDELGIPWWRRKDLNR